ncbi:MAG: amidohydrolase family protein [Desulforhopalus sp.]
MRPEKSADEQNVRKTITTGLAMKPIRIISMICMLAVLPLFQSCSGLIHTLGGNFKYEPSQMKENISPKAQQMIENSYRDNKDLPVIDYHTHILGLGTSCKECFVHPDFHDFFSPFQRFKFEIYMSASGITDPQKVDEQYVARLAALIRESGKPMKSAILAFDKHYKGDGSVNYDKTQFYVPNSYVYGLSQKYPDIFIPVISVHPYRQDAIDELEFWAKKGVKIVKWLPNAMGIDPSDPAIEPFYEKMAEHDMILLTHTGREEAVNAEDDQRLGNPLLLRAPLHHNIRVIMAHCSSLGTCTDLDAPDGRQVPCFDLFLRMMDQENWDGQLFGDISAILQHNRMPYPLKEILSRPQLHARLVHGSDYPLVAINSLIRTGNLAKEGFITEEERTLLNEIYDYNPLLFDFVLKRTVRLPGTDNRLSSAMFFQDLLEDGGDRP